MKKVLLVLGGLSAFACIGFFMIAMNASSAQKSFYAKVDAGQVDELMQAMHPALRAEIDQPVMETLVNAINTKLGNLTGVTQTSFSSSMDDSGTHVETEATVEFENGTATSKLTTLDGKIISFDIQSDTLGNWLVAPTSTGIYEDAAQEFMTTFLTGENGEAWDLCHDSLQESVSKDELKAMTQAALEIVGVVQSVKPISTRTDDDDGIAMLIVDLQVVGDRITTTGNVKFRFGGLKGDLTGFAVNIPGETAAESTDADGTPSL